MKNFQRSGGGGNRFVGKKFGKRSFGDRDAGRPMHKATCSECGNSCEVPFRPTNDRPVYCSSCFKKGDNGGNSRRSDDRSYGDRDRDFERDSGRPSLFEATCDECGETCEVPFKPTGNKPVYCNNCFKKGGNSNNNGGSKDFDRMKEQFEIFNIKLDRILKILTSTPAPVPASAPISAPKKLEKAVSVKKAKAPAKPKKEAKVKKSKKA